MISHTQGKQTHLFPLHRHLTPALRPPCAKARKGTRDRTSRIDAIIQSVIMKRTRNVIIIGCPARDIECMQRFKVWRCRVQRYRV
jgi:hypothetical protein